MPTGFASHTIEGRGGGGYCWSILHVLLLAYRCTAGTRCPDTGVASAWKRPPWHLCRPSCTCRSPPPFCGKLSRACCGTRASWGASALCGRRKPSACTRSKYLATFRLPPLFSFVKALSACSTSIFPTCVFFCYVFFFLFFFPSMY